MEYKSTVTAIGPQAIHEKDPMIILFGEKATTDLRQVAVIQQFEKQPTFHLKVGDTLSFDGENYQIQTLGRLANDNLTSIGHVTLIFGQTPVQDKLENALYLSPAKTPKITVGTEIIYAEV